MERGQLLTDERGQTLQDFAVGIGVFLVVFVFVLSLFPGLLTPFQSSASGAERAQAEQVTTQMMHNLSEGSEPNHLNATRVTATLNQPESDLRDRFGLPSTVNLNITVETLDGETHIESTVNRLYDREVATSARIITMDDPECDPACRLVVRVW
ncbi:DUF7287 family protein [Halapricum hydrolyticum]|uniref:Uncharacterized protein n=1 Tax=Halapricum hydrolyticum TaxID=2979991 RepID=A0AAE3LEC2_9EURY|nr:hypothetical protein [Halapricum hydrolyticum]MCU4716590.1 hypothetical protein [Halapricum hydrolyticum]MCU4725805.1 hypothetical protein [Halapricum hydrolyticum]